MIYSMVLSYRTLKNSITEDRTLLQKAPKWTTQQSTPCKLGNI